MTPIAWRFYALSCLGPLLVALPFALTGTAFTGVGSTLGGVIAMGSPLAAVLFLRWRGDVPSLPETLPLRPTSWPWMVGALLFPIGLNVVIAYAALAWPSVSMASGWEGLFAQVEGLLPPEEVEAQKASLQGMPPVPIIAVSAVFAGLTVNGLAAFGEEAGWRGLLDQELRPLGFWRRSLLIGVLWGLWHAPILLLGYNYPDHPLLGVFLFPIVLALLSPWMTLFRDKTGSVYSAALFHGAFNGSATAAFATATGGNDLTVGPGSLTAVAVLAILDVGLWLALRRRP